MEQELYLALNRVYMGRSSFPLALASNPTEAIAQLIANPARFGKLRSYLGSIMLKRHLSAVSRIARARKAPARPW